MKLPVWGVLVGGLVVWWSYHAKTLALLPGPASVTWYWSWMDIVVTVAGLVGGWWGTRCLPTRWFRHLRWVGLLIVSVNVVVSVWQIAHHPQWAWGVKSVAGLCGYDRYLGAQAVAWFPVLLAWLRPLALLPVWLV